MYSSISWKVESAVLIHYYFPSIYEPSLVVVTYLLEFTSGAPIRRTYLLLNFIETAFFHYALINGRSRNSLEKF